MTDLPRISPEKIQKQIPKQLAAANGLLEFAWENRPRKRAGPERFEDVLVAIYARSTLTYWSVIHLCEAGFAHQADMLTRSLFEDMVIAHWSSLPEHRTHVIAALEAQHDHSRLLWNDTAKRHHWLEEIAVDLTDLEQRRPELDKRFGKYGTKPWTGVNVHDMVGEVEQLWPDERGKRSLWSYYDVMHRLNNLTMHQTSTSISQTTRREAGTVRFLMRPTSDAYELTRTLAGAFWTYAQLFSLVVDELVPEAKTEFTKRHDEWQFCFYPPPRRGDEEANRPQ